jgi:hypothetical protein
MDNDVAAGDSLHDEVAMERKQLAWRW